MLTDIDELRGARIWDRKNATVRDFSQPEPGHPCHGSEFARMMGTLQRNH